MNIYLDENLSHHVANALNTLNYGYFGNHKVFSTKDKFDEGEVDEVIIPTLGQEGSILITRDYNIKTSSQYKLCKQHNLSAFFIKPHKNHFKHWDLVRILIKHWEQIMNILNTEHPPFAYIISVNKGLTKVKI